MTYLSGFNATIAAQVNASVAGIMAGFSFAALVWLVERLAPREEYNPTQELTVRALALLGLVFMGNILIAFLYARIAGQTDPGSQRTASLGFLAGAEFALFAVLMTESLVMIVSAAAVPLVVALFRPIFFGSLLVTTAFHAATTIRLMAAQGDLGAASGGGEVFIGAAVLSLLIILAGIALSFRPEGRRLGLNSMAAFRWLVIAILIMSIAWGVLFNLVASSPPETTLPQGWVIASTLVWAIALGWGCAFLPLEHGSATQGVRQEN